MKTTRYVPLVLLALIVAIICNDHCLAQFQPNDLKKQGDKVVKQENKAKPTEAPAKKNVKTPKPYTPAELMDIVRNAAISTRADGWVYLDPSRRSIAQYLYYVQMAQGERLRNDQIATRLKILALDAKEVTPMWHPGGMNDDRINGTAVKTDYIFTVVYNRSFAAMIHGKESDAMKKAREIEEKALALYKEAQVGRGL